MEATVFWNLSKNNTKDTNDFFSTHDVTKTPLNNISFANNTKVEVAPLPVVTTPQITTPEESKEKFGKYNEEEIKDEEYCLELICLNKCVLEWIKKHIKKNPCIDLSPVIKDYEKHLSDIGIKYKVRINTKQTTLFTTPEATHPSPVTSLSANKDMVSFVSSTPINNGSTSAVVKFPPAGFFASSSEKPLVEKNDANNQDRGGENPAEDAPPVCERKIIIEDDAFYQIRTKLFFKKGAQWQELGTGMLYLKPCGDKIQLLIRMEAVTGKVLLNINISKELPLSRSGKNNVMVVSVPNPPVFAKPTDGDNSVPCTYLIRLKGAVEADELYLKLKSKF